MVAATTEGSDALLSSRYSASVLAASLSARSWSGPWPELADPACGDVAELGPDEAGLDQDDLDAEPADLLTEGVGVGLEGVLGGVAPGAEGEGEAP